MVRKFYDTLVKQARAIFSDARHQTERWTHAVVLPLEIQMKDHKAQLQSRLDNLAKINEKTSSINEQMAVVKAAEAELRKQREMIEGLIARVSEYDESAVDTLTRAPAAPAAPRARAPADPMATTKLSTFEPEKTQMQPAAPAAPLMDDSAFASLVKKPAEPAPAAPAAFDPMKTQKMDATATQKLPPNAATTQKLSPDDAQRTQRMDSQDAQRTQQLPQKPGPVAAPQPPGERTMKIQKLDPGFRPDATQQIGNPHERTTQLKVSAEPSPNTTQKLDPPPASQPPASNAESTQRLDDSIWRLQEAKRMLQKLDQPK